MLIIFSGLSGTGKTAITRELARQIGVLHPERRPFGDSGSD
jgi:cytidylate kinase